MIVEIKELLNAQELTRLREIAGSIKFIDGRASNAGFDLKSNLQADPRHATFQESSKIVGDAFLKSREFRDFAFPKQIAPPLLARYEPGMKYGPHADAAFLPLPSGPMRSDLSCTVFLSDPVSYEGGELVLHFGARSVALKAQAGGAVVYPSTTLHEVAPVRSGQRLVSITFVESYISEERNREILYELGEISALEGANMHWANRMRLEVVRQNLTRRWSAGS
jgi:PKHD-type hydroxylase